MQAHTYVIISYHIRHTHRVRVGLISKKRERKKERKKNRGKERKMACLPSPAACSLNSASAQFQGALSCSGVCVFDLTNHAQV